MRKQKLVEQLKVVEHNIFAFSILIFMAKSLQTNWRLLILCVKIRGA